MSFDLLRELKIVDQEAERIWPTCIETARYDRGLGHVGLIGLQDEPKRETYWNTPTNSIAFAFTGIDGVHFSFLTSDPTSYADAPVVMTTPADRELSYVVGENLREFLCLGCVLGYQEVRSFACEQDRSRFSSESAEQEEGGNLPSSFFEAYQGMLELLRNRLNLKPWSEPNQRYEELERLYLSKIILTDAS